jgi:hypothetical protein
VMVGHGDGDADETNHTIRNCGCGCSSRSCGPAQSEEYNRLNCETARQLFAAEGVTVRYWCEKGRYRP